MPGVTWLERIMDAVADRGRELLRLRENAAQDTPADLCRRLIASRGEASNIALAREILQRFEALAEGEKTAFLLTLAEEFGPDPERIRAAASAFDNDLPATLVELLKAVEPPRQDLFRRLNMAPHGTAALVSMREQLLHRLPELPKLGSVDADLKHLLASWFNRGFLRLQAIDWRSPAVVLEKLMRYEAVHPITGWEDLRRRLSEDRRCFGFFHPALPEEPLIFVEVALTQGMAAEIAPLIDPAAPVDDPYAADTAMFYSINNALRGLRGISFGNFLLKQVLSELGSELPNLQQFATLSPMPRFARGLQRLCAGEVADWPVEKLDRVLDEYRDTLQAHTGDASPCAAILHLLQHRSLENEPLLAQPLARIALLYLVDLKQADTCFDPVAAFHLANGAVLERINVFADRSEQGEAQSHSVMVNYRYDPEQVVANHEAFVREGRIAMSRSLRRVHEKYIKAEH
jgi:malonyl-CoA decarboxylase